LPREGLVREPAGLPWRLRQAFRPGELELGWCPAGCRQFEPGEARDLLARLTDSPLTALAYIHHGKDQLPDGWYPLMALGSVNHNQERIDYIVANRDVPDRYASADTRTGPPKRYPIYEDEEITPDSRINFVAVDKHTALYYRDLFVHRLGTTAAERYFLMLIDGRAVTALGLHRRDLDRGITEYLGETFGSPAPPNATPGWASCSCFA